MIAGHRAELFLSPHLREDGGLKRFSKISWILIEFEARLDLHRQTQLKAGLKRRYPLSNIFQHLGMLEPLEKHKGLITWRRALTWHAPTMTPSLHFPIESGNVEESLRKPLLDGIRFLLSPKGCHASMQETLGITFCHLFHSLSLAVHCWVSSSSLFDCLRHDINQRITFAWRTRKVYTR